MESNKKINLACFASGSGTTFDYLSQSPHFNMRVCVTNKADCGATQVAQKHQVPVRVICKKDYSTQEEWDKDMYQQISDQSIDLVILAGYLSQVGPYFLSQYKNRVLNSHPSLLPKYGGHGMYGAHVHKSVLDNQEIKTGITVHFVNERYDEGQIVAQKEIPVLKNDTVDSLQERVKKEEKQFYADCILQVWNQIEEKKVKFEL